MVDGRWAVATGQARAAIVEQEDEEVEVEVDTEDSEGGASGLDGIKIGPVDSYLALVVQQLLH